MEAMDSLERDGFVVIRNAVAPALVSELNERIKRFKERNAKAAARNLDEHGRMYRVVNLHLAVDSITRLLTENAAIAVCDQFFGEPTSLYTSLYYEKGSEQSLHRDTPLFATSPLGRYMGVWVALDEVGDDNGPLMVVRGSHALPQIDVQAMRQQVFGDGPIDPMSPEGWEAYQTAVAAQCTAAGLSAEPVHVSPGDVIIWHPQLFHGGAAHTASRMRRSVVMHVTPKGMPVGHQDVFFEPGKSRASAPWRYYQRGDRHIARFKHVDFGHAYKVRTWFLRKG
ncbi:phytanoyl-CoA dioxygenase family protein [Stenotrophomonas sp.]|uniref:phytanoyl-CoA dioxygenase family protein n=1 Tax=Stenotrophomonas sp. TaxID=69392 RepID=UPI0028A1739C|nr:phytanoyl-CoA dioxygenase family protein [Stenotrophomonas sp.]